MSDSTGTGSSSENNRAGTRPPALKPCVTMQYPTHAMLRGASNLPNTIGKTRRAIADELGLHPNTVAAIIRSQRAEYENVNLVFTVLNVGMSNNLPRKDYVLSWDGLKESSFVDDNLEQCLVFPRLEDLLNALDAKILGGGSVEKRIGDLACVQTVFINQMLRGLPVPKNLVEATFEAVNRLSDLTLEQASELFN